jgi:hypothetical protein
MEEEYLFAIELRQHERSIEVMFPEGATDAEKRQHLNAAIAVIEQNGKRVVGAEPITRIYRKVIGSRFIVEDEDAWDKRQQEKVKEVSCCAETKLRDHQDR